MDIFHLHVTVASLLAFTCITCTYGKNFKRVCYYTSWSGRREVVESHFHIKDIDPTLCSHLIYAFANINTEYTKLEWFHASEDNGKVGDERKGNYYDFTGLKKQYPGLKTLLSVGGENSAKKFEDIAGPTHDLQIFANNVRIFLHDRNFDGIDIDWEFPKGEYKAQFSTLLKEIRLEFQRYANETGNPEMLLTIAGPPGKDTIDNGYDIPEIVKYVDFINVMAYDYAGAWSNKTGFNSPLYSRLSDTAEFDRTLSQNWTMHRYINLGAPPEKLIMGINGAGATFVLSNNSIHGVGAPIEGAASGGPLLKIPGKKGYQEICMMLADSTKEWDEEQRQNFAYNGDQWVGYDDPISIAEKIEYANKSFGGVMFWSLDLDDFSGEYCQQGKYPLLSAMNSRLSTTKAPISTKTQFNETTTTTTTVWPPTDGGFTVYTENGNVASTKTQSFTMNSRLSTTKAPISTTTQFNETTTTTTTVRATKDSGCKVNNENANVASTKTQSFTFTFTVITIFYTYLS